MDLSESQPDLSQAVGHGLAVTRMERLEGTSLVWVEGVDLLDQMCAQPTLVSFIVDVGAEPA